jgi:TRAP-type C4-dicarboxylate transport system permease small subunit
MSRRLLDGIGKAEAVIISAIMLMISGLVFSQVITRYVLQLSAPWLEELTRFLMIWMIMLGCAYAVRTRQHIVVNIVETGIRSPRARRFYNGFLAICGLAFAVTLAVLAYVVVERTARFGQVSGAMRIPMYWANGSFLVAAVLMSLHYLVDLIASIRSEPAERNG